MSDRCCMKFLAIDWQKYLSTQSSVFSNDLGRIDFPSSHSLTSLGILRAFIISALASNDCQTIHDRLSTQCESRVATNTTDHRSKEGTLPVQSLLRRHETNISQRSKESCGKQTNRKEEIHDGNCVAHSREQ